MTLNLEKQKTRCGFVGIFGKPNAGKSTLLNALLGEDLSIVTSKEQTTWHRIPGIVTLDKAQIIFVDTPGIHDRKDEINRRMLAAAEGNVGETDLNLLLVDGSTKDPMQDHLDFFEWASRLPGKKLIVLTKTDRLREKERLNSILIELSAAIESEGVFPVSALKKEGLVELSHNVIKHLPKGPFLYPSDELSDLPTRFFVQELIRKELFQLFDEEIPYQSAVKIELYNDKKDLVEIHADVWVERNSQKQIIVGTNGAQIKELGTRSRIAIEKLLGKRVFLKLFVKVIPSWTKNHYRLKDLGLQKPSHYKRFHHEPKPSTIARSESP